MDKMPVKSAINLDTNDVESAQYVNGKPVDNCFRVCSYQWLDDKGF